MLVDAVGERVDAAAVFFRDLRAAGRSVATQRSYGMDLLRWFRFLWAVEVPWGRATRVEARDFSCWMALVDQAPPRRRLMGAGRVGVNPVTGKASPGSKYAASTLAHSETVLRCFYDFHLDDGRGPLVNPFPLVCPPVRAGPVRITTRWSCSPHAAFAGLYRPRCRSGFRGASRTTASTRSSPRCGRTGTGRWSRSGFPPARAPRSCWARVRPTPCRAAADHGGSEGRAGGAAAAGSADAFVWLRLYQLSLRGRARPQGGGDPLWWTNSEPLRPLSYHAARAMFTRANQGWGRTGRCTTFVTPRPIGWRATRRCRCATSSGSWAMPTSPPHSCT